MTYSEAFDSERMPRRFASSSPEPAGHKRVPFVVWLLVLATLILIPLRIVSYGYLPPDDGLRHAAKAVSGREWSEILVLQDRFKMDHSPGWHWVLGHIHHLTRADTEPLVVMAVCILSLLVFLTPLPALRRPEAWIAALLASAVAFPEFIVRVFYARPLDVSMSVTLAILLLWRRKPADRPSFALLAISSILFGLAAWVHGSWYLFGLVIAAFALAGHWRSSLWLTGCWLLGAFGGALLTGHPFAFLANAIKIAFSCFGNNQVQRVLVGEFGPSDGCYVPMSFAALLLVLRAVSGQWNWSAVRNPVFMLVLISWVLGLRVVRFWVDWAVPALALWTALELHEHLQRHLNAQSFRRLAISAALCLALFFGATSDLRGRWTNNLTTEYLSQSDPEMAPWLPEDGGIIYSSYMGVFYNTFFKNPHAKWKYILGFESTFMPPDDLRILRNIQWNYHAPRAHDPWVAKMRPQDRLVILGSSSTAPPIPDLEWKNVARETWVGRLPRSPAPATR